MWRALVCVEGALAETRGSRSGNGWWLVARERDRIQVALRCLEGGPLDHLETSSTLSSSIAISNTL